MLQSDLHCFTPTENINFKLKKKFIKSKNSILAGMSIFFAKSYTKELENFIFPETVLFQSFFLRKRLYRSTQ